jgi:hypothetical protein
MDLSTLNLPPHIHAEMLDGRDVVSGETLTYPVIWADRITDTCDRCRQPTPREEPCPVLLNSGAGQGGQIEETSQQHGCGEWLSVAWVDLGDVDPDATDLPDRIEAAARELAGERAAEIQAATERMRRSLERDLARALKHLGEPLDGDAPDDRIYDVTDGSEVEPGVYLDETAGVWVAWDYEPGGGEGDAVSVTADTVSYAQAGSMLGVSRARVGALVAEGKLVRGGEAGVTVASVLERMTSIKVGR